ncbi:sulfatase [Flavihumibacter fluvii]|uniref:sulfatase n=1 Tax=Flavihumibacter fluvii TaxID=2838157 RepID=UPI001BDE782C|nr:sulfatase [Flavihumibacter fluvii]ULQ51935.1 sulfatase [Flavihumibacter fluvii]
MRKFLVLLAASLFAHTAADSQATAKNKPNIILFLVDDMGWEDARKYHTPNIDKLAAGGKVFTNAYANNVCTPTRVSLVTGFNAAHHHITNWTHPEKDHSADAPDDQFLPTEWNYNGLSPQPGIPHTFYARPLPAILKDAGYFTVHVGKAHWAAQGTPGVSPYNLGFIVNISGHAAGHPQSYLSEENYGNLPGKNSAQSVPDLEEYYQSGTFLTEALTKEALKAIELPVKNKQPFFLNLAHYAVHVPLMADKRFFQAYLDKGLDSAEAQYASLVEGVDASLGEVMQFLEDRNIDKNTVVIFLSDNGGLSNSPPRGGESFTHNLPLRAGKGSLYEGGIRVPLVVRYPPLVKANSTTAQPVIAEDFFPTVLDLAGITPAAAGTPIDGRSFYNRLKDQGSMDTGRAFIWHYPNKWKAGDGPAINYYSAIRKGDWKLVYSLRTRQSELYNLQADLGEWHDLAKQYPAKVKELEKALGQILKSYDAPMPVERSTGIKLPYPGTN